MADPIIKVERAMVELKIKNLMEQLKKQEPEFKTQHLRGQISVWEQIEEWGIPKLPIKITKRDPNDPTATPLY